MDFFKFSAGASLSLFADRLVARTSRGRLFSVGKKALFFPSLRGTKPALPASSADGPVGRQSLSFDSQQLEIAALRLSAG